MWQVAIGKLLLIPSWLIGQVLAENRDSGTWTAVWASFACLVAAAKSREEYILKNIRGASNGDRC